MEDAGAEDEGQNENEEADSIELEDLGEEGELQLASEEEDQSSKEEGQEGDAEVKTQEAEISFPDTTIPLPHLLPNR